MVTQGKDIFILWKKKKEKTINFVLFQEKEKRKKNHRGNIFLC